ncbi:MAG: VWA domain-containing protein, partial [Algicola sp.]|nr:VWA domain-containing protein [Algicola sp.]
LSTGSANNSFVLDSAVALLVNDPWGFLEITVTPGGGNALGYSASAVAKACDCYINIAGKVYRKGRKKSKLYIMLIVDASGSTNDSVGNKRVFDVEIDALKALVDNLTANNKTLVGVIKFATAAEVVVDFSNDLDFVKTALDSITPEISGTSGAATNYQAALELANDTFASANPKKRDIKTVAFLSDGIPTAPFGSGNTQEAGDRIAGIEAAGILAEAGITVNTFPVNVFSNLTTLPAISAITQGLYYHHPTDEVESMLPNDSLVGIVGLEMENVTTSEQALDLILRPDGLYSGSICLTSDEVNEIQVTPSVCETCDKVAYQKIKVNCTAEQCSTCAGQVTNLQMQYSGTLADAAIRVTQRKNANKVYSLFDDTVQPGESFDFSGGARNRTMGSSIQVFVNDELNTEFVTSCGQPKIGPGLIQGDFEVLKGYSRNGGLLCPVE